MNDIFRELKRDVDFDFEHNDAYTVVSQMLVEWCETRERHYVCNSCFGEWVSVRYDYCPWCGRRIKYYSGEGD